MSQMGVIENLPAQKKYLWVDNITFKLSFASTMPIANEMAGKC